MPRLILGLAPRASAASVQATVQALPFVQDAVQTSQIAAVIVNVDEVTADVRQQLADQPGVDAVFDDLQAVPQVASEELTEDFLQQVRARRGEELPPTLSTKPLVADGGDGGTIALPPLTATPPTPESVGPIEDIDAALAFAGVNALHERGIRGDGVIAVVVDTGVSRENIRPDRQLDGLDLTGDDDPWSPLSGHGTMTAGIMAGDESTAGIDVGVAPEADVFPIKTTLAASELLQAQDAIVELAEETGHPVIVNNSWGFRDCTGLCDHPMTRAIANAASHARVAQVFAAGNQGGDEPGACGAACDGTPGINGPNSLNEVLTVGATGRDGEAGTLQPYSCRGGADGVGCGTEKPDLTAPVFGQMPWGAGARDMGNGGGTSAACPQVAGALALRASRRGATAQSRTRRAFTTTADQLTGSGFNGCSGWGNLQADAAFSATPSAAPSTGIDRETAGVAATGIGAGLIGAFLRRRLGL